MNNIIKNNNSNNNEMNNKFSYILINRLKNGEVKTNKGVSFLETKYQIMIQYILQLAFIIHSKLSGQSIKDHPVIESLVELRVILERMKPIETKLKYQIDKLVRTAVMGEQQQQQQQQSKDSKNSQQQSKVYKYMEKMK